MPAISPPATSGGRRDRAARGGEQCQRGGLGEHSGDDQRLAAHAVGPVAGADLRGRPDSRVEAGDQSDLGSRGAIGGEEQRQHPPIGINIAASPPEIDA
jgi:hypothetical protein